MAPESPKSQGVSIDQRCWDCGYDLRGLVEVDACPECGALQGEAGLAQRRERFLQKSWGPVWRSLGICISVGIGLIVLINALEGWFWAGVVFWSPGWFWVFGPFVIALLAWVWVVRVEPAIRALAFMCYGRAMWRAVVPLSLATACGTLSPMASIPAMCIGIVAASVAFKAQWNRLADTVGLPIRTTVGGMVGWMVAACSLTHCERPRYLISSETGPNSSISLS